MKTGEELHCKVYLSPRLPRVTLVPNSQHFMSTGRPVAVVVQIFDSQAFHTPLLNKLKQIAKEQLDDKLSNSKVTQNRNMLLKDHWEIRGDQPLQSQNQRILLLKWTTTEIFEFYCDFFEETVSRSRFILTELVSYTARAENACSHTERESTIYTKTDLTYCRFLDTWWKKNQYWGPWTWSNNASHNVSQSTWYVEKSQKCKEGSLPNYFWKMVQRWQVPQVVVWRRLDRRTNQTIRRTCIGRSLLWSFTCRKATIGKELTHCFFFLK